MQEQIQEQPMKVSIPVDIFDRIERYLESKLPDGEAALILQMLEDEEIDRTYQEYFSPNDQL